MVLDSADAECEYESSKTSYTNPFSYVLNYYYVCPLVKKKSCQKTIMYVLLSLFHGEG